MRKLTYLLLASALLASVSSAHAELKTVARSGGWSVLAGFGGEKQKTPMCVMSVGGSDARLLMIKWQATTDGVFIHLFKESWRIPAGTKMPVEVSFDNGESVFGGTAKAVSDSSGGVELWIANDKGDGSYTTIKRFMAFFKEAEIMHVAFPGGSEPTWSVNMDGSEKVARHFWNCVGAVNKTGGGATQPHGGGTPSATQPFGKKKPVADRDAI